MADTTGGGNQLADVFTGLLSALESQAKAQHDAARGGAARPWNRPPSPGPVLDPTSVAGWDRTTLGTGYESLVADPAKSGSSGAAASLTVQSDYVAVHERGYRARHCTPVRLAGFAAARRRGHGHPNGAFGGDVSRYAQDLIKAGSS